MWKQQAESLFFIESMSITDIAAKVSKARETVSRYICKLPGYEEEMRLRAERSALARKEYNRSWMEKSRKRQKFEAYYGSITSETIRHEHETAVKVLSAEKY